MCCGLLSNVERKNIESIAYRLGQSRLPLQSFIGWDAWDDAPLREELRSQVKTHLGQSDGVLVFDPSGFPKSGRESVGVARQWCGRLGKVDNCQVAISLGYVSRKGHTLVDTRLYLPKEWTKDTARLDKAGVPKTSRAYRTRHQLALEMLEKTVPRCRIDGLRVTTRWDDRLGFVVAWRVWVSSTCWPCLRTHRCAIWRSSGRRRAPGGAVPSAPGNTSRPGARRWMIPPGTGSMCAMAVKGRWWWKPCRDVWCSRTHRRQQGDPETLVVLRYRDRDQAQVVKVDYYLSNAAPETPLGEFARVAEAEHRIEECLQRSKSEAGLADYEVRNWTGWQHHQTLSLLATWFLVRETERGKKMDSGDHPTADSPGHCPELVRGVSVRDALAEAEGVSAALATQ